MQEKEKVSFSCRSLARADEPANRFSLRDKPVFVFRHNISADKFAVMQIIGELVDMPEPRVPDGFHGKIEEGTVVGFKLDTAIFF